MNTNITYLPCDDAQEVLTMSLITFDNDKTYMCEFNILDGYCYTAANEHGLIKRLRRAWKALIGKEIIYTGIFVEDMSRAKKWLQDCQHKIEEVEKEYTFDH